MKRINVTANLTAKKTSEPPAPEPKPRRSKSPQTALERGDWSPKPKTAIVHNIADLLLWARKHYPGEFITHREIAKAVFLKARLPVDGAREVEQVLSAVSRVRELLLTSETACTVVVLRGHGIRASVGSEDVASNVVPQAARNLKRKAENLKAVTDLVDMKEIPVGPQRDWLQKLRRDTQPLFDDTFLRNLLPPKAEE